MLQLATPPANAYELIAQAISQLSTVGGSADRVTRVNDPAKLSAALQHKLYTLQNSDIIQGRNLDRARLLAWRFLIQLGTKTIAATEFLCDSQGRNLRFASLDTGPFAQGTRETVRLAEGLASVKAGSYELRALRAPSAYAMALWLKNLQSGDDIIIPITPAGPGRQPATGGSGPMPQSPKDFMDGLRSAASTGGFGSALPPSSDG